MKKLNGMGVLAQALVASAAVIAAAIVGHGGLAWACYGLAVLALLG